MGMEFNNIFKSSGIEGAKLVATSKPGDTDKGSDVHVVDQNRWAKKVAEKQNQKSGPEKAYPFKTQESQYKDLLNKIIIAKSELSDILNRKPLVKQDREEASAKRNEIKYLENELADYEKSQQN